MLESVLWENGMTAYPFTILPFAGGSGFDCMHSSSEPPLGKPPQHDQSLNYIQIYTAVK